MARVLGTQCNLFYTYYRDLIVLMSGVQKAQNALLPVGATGSLYEFMISNVTSNGPVLTYGATNQWLSLQDLYSFDQTQLLYSFEMNIDDSSPIQLHTCWVQLTLSVRLKSNPTDMVSGVIKMVPSLNVVGPPPPPPPLWTGGYTIGVIFQWTAAPSYQSRLLKEVWFNTDGTWADTTAALPQFNSTGRWLPAGASAANYSMRAREVTTLVHGTVDSQIGATWRKMNTRAKIAVECYTGKNTVAGTYESRWYGTIDVRNDLTGEIEYSGGFWTRSIIQLN